jgi:hypothetical protein
MRDPDKKWSEADKAWLACAIDSEGTIVLARDSRHPNTMNARVDFYNSNFEFAESFAVLTQSRLRPRPPRGLGKKEQYTVSVCSKDKVRELLSAVQPFLIVKKAKATAVLAYISKYPLTRQENMRHQNMVLPRTEQGYNSAR